MITAVTMVKDEADIIVHTILHLLAQGVDRVIVADNLSTDATPELLEALARVYPVTVLQDDEPGYYQAEKMTRLAHLAWSEGAEWIVPFDADEFWCDLSLLRTTDAQVVEAITFDHRPVEPFPSRWRALIPKRLPKVAFRPAPGFELHMGNHDVTLEGKRVRGMSIREFQYRSYAQFVRKVKNGKRAYDATDLKDIYGAHWRILGALDDEGLREVWAELSNKTELVCDPAPLSFPITETRSSSRTAARR